MRDDPPSLFPVPEGYFDEINKDPFTKPPIPAYVGRTDDLGPPECELGKTTKDEVFESLATGIAAIASLEEGDDEPIDADFFNDWLINPAPETIDTFPKKMKWLARLTEASRKWEAELKQIKEKIEELEPYVLEEFALNGIERQTVGGFTFYPQTEMWVNKKAEKDGVTTEMVCTALKNTGLGYMVGDSYSASSLKSKIKEMKEAGIDIPDELKAVLNVGEKVKLIARKA